MPLKERKAGWRSWHFDSAADCFRRHLNTCSAAPVYMTEHMFWAQKYTPFIAASFISHLKTSWAQKRTSFGAACLITHMNTSWAHKYPSFHAAWLISHLKTSWAQNYTTFDAAHVISHLNTSWAQKYTSFRNTTFWAGHMTCLAG